MNYSHEEKLALSNLFSVQKILYYKLMCTTRVMTNSNPMKFLLSQRIINEKYARWVVILQELDLEFVKQKSKKGFSLAEFITELPTSMRDPPINDDLPDEHLFAITLDDPWYGDIIAYL